MKKWTLILGVLLFSFSSVFSDDSITLYPISHEGNDHREEQPIPTPHTLFWARITTGALVEVSSNVVTTFSVEIRSIDDSDIVYWGRTVEGIIHFTNSLAPGSYTISVLNRGNNYTGQFEIH